MTSFGKAAAEQIRDISGVAHRVPAHSTTHQSNGLLRGIGDLKGQLQDALGSCFVVQRELDGGGMSRVFVVRDIQLGRAIVVKVLPPDALANMAIERFRREIQVAAQLQHPCIVPVLTAGNAFDFPFYTMPFVEGETLKEKVEREGPLPIAECVKVLRDVASALAYAHARGIVHRDLKPANVLMSGGYAVVTDFGIAKALRDSRETGDEDLTSAGIAIGTPAYMAPEQVFADPGLDHRSDIYSWGILAYELLTGKPPFVDASAQRILAAQVVEIPDPVHRRRHDVPAVLATLVMRCLAKQPSDRPETAIDIVHTLDLPATTSGERVALDSKSTLRPAIAVLPFVNLSADPENEYFSDGMTDEIINVLTHTRTMRVASRVSSFAFKGKDPDIRAVAAQLNVSSVLVGTVRRSGTRLRISGQLIDVATNSLVWSEHYDRQMADVFDIQDEIAAAIVSSLELTLLGTDVVPAKRRPTDNLEAYDLYLKGRYYWNQRGDGIRKGLEFFHLALKLDPNYALALVGIADAYVTMGFYDFMPPGRAYPIARDAALRALAIDDSLAEAHTSLAIIAFFYEWDWEGARREFERALELDSSYLQAHMWFGALHVAFRRFTQGIAHARRTLELDPLSPLAHIMLGWFLFKSRRNAEAIDQLTRTAALDPHRFLTHLLLGLAQSQAGKDEDAIQSLHRSVALSARAPWPVAALAHVYGRAGKITEARELLEELRTRQSTDYIPHSRVAMACMAVGEVEAALDCLEAARRARETWTVILLIDPTFDALRTNPRFVRLLETTGMVMERGSEGAVETAR